MTATTAAVDIAPSLVREPRAPISEATVIAIASTGSTIVQRGPHRRHGNHGMTAAMTMAATPAAMIGPIEVPADCSRSALRSAPMTVSGPASGERARGVPCCLSRIVGPSHTGMASTPHSGELTLFSRSGSDAPLRRSRPTLPACSWRSTPTSSAPGATSASTSSASRSNARRTPAEIEVGWRAFQLDPRARTEPTPVFDAYVRKFGGEDAAAAVIGRITGAAAAVGLELRLDRALRVNTFDAHRLVWFAGDGARQWDRRAGAACEAYLVEGRNVADRPTLVAIAEAVGLVPAEVEAFLAGSDGVRRGAGRARVGRRPRRARRPDVLLRERRRHPGCAGPRHVREGDRPRRHSPGGSSTPGVNVPPSTRTGASSGRQTTPASTGSA